MPNAKFCNSCPASAAVVASVDSLLTTVPLHYYSIRLNSYPEILLDLFQNCLQFGCDRHFRGCQNCVTKTFREPPVQLPTIK